MVRRHRKCRGANSDKASAAIVVVANAIRTGDLYPAMGEVRLVYDDDDVATSVAKRLSLRAMIIPGFDSW